MEKFLKSRLFLGIIIGLAELALLIIVFRTGMVVGFRKANFSFQWRDNYHGLFVGRGHGPGPGGSRGPIGDFPNDDLIPGHGVAGTILKVDGSSVLVKDDDNVEQSLLISSNTAIRSDSQNLKISDLKENDRVVGIGSPSTTGQIEIKFLRVFK